MRLVILAFVLLLGGCATQAQRQFQAIKSGNTANAAQLKECGTAVYNSADFAPLRSHLPASVADATLQQLADASLASPEEVRAIYAIHPQMQQCRKTFLTNLAQTEPSLVPIFTTSFNKADDDLGAVTQRKLSWGDYLHRARDRSTQLQAQIQTEDRRVVGELKEEHNAEIAQRQRAAEALAAWAQTQELINAANRPVITNCSSFGNTVNCMSR